MFRLLSHWFSKVSVNIGSDFLSIQIERLLSEFSTIQTPTSINIDIVNPIIHPMFKTRARIQWLLYMYPWPIKWDPKLIYIFIIHLDDRNGGQADL